MRTKYFLVFFLCLIHPMIAFAALDYTSIQPNTWVELQANGATGVYTTDVGTTLPSAPQFAYSSTALDSIHSTILAFGGGHADWPCNAVWAFDVTGINGWQKISTEDCINQTIYTVSTMSACVAHVSEPSYIGMWSARDTFPASDNRPISRHTYQSVQFDPSLGVMIAGGSSTWSQESPETDLWNDVGDSSNGGGCYHNSSFDTWKFTPPSTVPGTGTWSYQGSSYAYQSNGIYQSDAPTGNLVWATYDSDNNTVLSADRLPGGANWFVWKYDPSQSFTSAWSQVGQTGGPSVSSAEPGFAYDTKRHLMYMYDCAVRTLYSYSPSTDTWATVNNSSNAPTTGGGNPPAPSLAYDSLNDIVLLIGVNAGIWIYNPTTNSWSQQSSSPQPSGANSSAPSLQGRLHYDATRNVFFYVEVSENPNQVNVWAYRYAENTPVTPNNITPGTPITTLTLREKNGNTSTNWPLTVGMIFKDGDAPSGSVVSFQTQSGTTLSTQYECKRSWPDGSCKHAVMSAIIPSIPANTDTALNLVLGGTNAAGTGMTKSQILATNSDASISLTNFVGSCSGSSNYSGTKTSDLQTAVSGKSSLNYWLQGSVVTEILVKDPILDGSNRPQLNAAYELRIYNTGAVRISSILENVEGDYRGNVNYDVTLNTGTQGGSMSTAYSKTGVQHPYMSRWRKTYWLGTAPDAVEVRYDPSYLVSTNLLPNYDTTLSMSSSTLSYWPAQVAASNHDILQNGIIHIPISDPAGRPDIGLNPGWNVTWLLSQDYGMMQVMLSTADLAGGLNIHWRESEAAYATTMGGVAGHIINITDRPEFWIQSPTDCGLPAAVCAASASATVDWWGGGTIDFSHIPNLAYIPYLFTGEHYYLDELYYYANWALANWSYSNSGQGTTSTWGRDYSYGYAPNGTGQSQLREFAWVFRNWVDAASVAPTGDPEIAYFNGIISNNQPWFATLAAVYPLHAFPVNVFCSVTTNCSNCCACPYMLNGNGVSCESNYENYFMDASVEHAIEQGYTGFTSTSQNTSQYIVGAITGTGANPFLAASERRPITDANGNNLSSWSHLASVFYEQPTNFTTWTCTNPSDPECSWNGTTCTNTSCPSHYISYPDDSTAYQVILAAAAAMLYKESGGPAAYTWIDANVCGGHSARYALLAADPTWAIVPRGTISPGTNAPPTPTGLKLLE